ncbi:MAG: (2Fe-2S)-binding protein, partial [Eubacteriales bacterium]|nr:(2Fe-2S)-binding protein [Eubacteriales bacterium]
RYGLKANEKFNPIRRDIPHLAVMAEEERNKLIAENPDYGRIVCRCEVVSEGEIRASICRPLGARSFDGVKRRTRAGMGRCQSGFCCPEIVKILSEELGVSEEEILKDDNVATMLIGRTK